jgi:hypothetical protein
MFEKPPGAEKAPLFPTWRFSRPDIQKYRQASSKLTIILLDLEMRRMMTFQSIPNWSV